MALDKHLNGVAIPVASLRSRLGCGIGEFLDLPLLGAWCRRVGLDLIQILPVNDTGSNASPYAAVSAFALHPAYIRLQEVPSWEHAADEIRWFQQSTRARQRVDFSRVLSFKLEMLRRLYRVQQDAGSDVDGWIDKNPWVRSYSVYKCLKDQHGEHSWIEWDSGRQATAQDIDRWWKEMGDEARFHAWVQYHLDRQLRAAAAELDRQEIFLKGDIPILMNVDSADVWEHRSHFDLSFLAGAPPDMFATLGQVWGFPTYDWDDLERNGFLWWRRRLEVASRYYHAFRIDHVLGFFRIWSTPAKEKTAVLGYYRPSRPLTEPEVTSALPDRTSLHRLTQAWTTEANVQDRLGESARAAIDRYFVRHDSGDLLLLDAFCSERTIESLDEPVAVKDFLTHCHRDRTLLTIGAAELAPAWFWRDSSGYAEATADERLTIQELVDGFNERSGPTWTEMGRKLLRIVKDASNMLPCAEDLGVVPQGTAEVLEELGILSLKIERWETDDEGRLKDPSTFRFLSVSTPGVHDTSALRGWWEEDGWERESFCTDLGLDDCPPWLTTDAAQAVLRRSLRSGSAIRAFQIQDLFTLTNELRTVRPADERINTPGSVSDANWSYVIPLVVESLPEHAITGILAGLVAESKADSHQPDHADG